MRRQDLKYFAGTPYCKIRASSNYHHCHRSAFSSRAWPPFCHGGPLPSFSRGFSHIRALFGRAPSLPPLPRSAAMVPAGMESPAMGQTGEDVAQSKAGAVTLSNTAAAAVGHPGDNVECCGRTRTTIRRRFAEHRQRPKRRLVLCCRLRERDRLAPRRKLRLLPLPAPDWSTYS